MSVVHGGEGSSTKFFGNAFTDGTGIFKFDVETGALTEIPSEYILGIMRFHFLPIANSYFMPTKLKLQSR